MRVATDPFSECKNSDVRGQVSVLGANITLDSTDSRLIDLAQEAFGRLPQYRLGLPGCRLHVRLVLTECGATWATAAEPPHPALKAGNGLLCATVDAGNYAVIDPEMSRALVCISRAMLKQRYHARYELVELALLTLASRAQSLVPLHAACIGTRGSGLLLMGKSGAGKSTVSLHAFARGLSLLAEDSAFVAPSSMLITGTPNFLHVEHSALQHLDQRKLKELIRCSPLIQRRSGKRKLEVDVRGGPGSIASSSLRLSALIFLKQRRAVRGSALVPISRELAVARLRREQSYACGLPNWLEFENRVAELPAFELRRTDHPDLAVDELEALLCRSRDSA